MDMQIAMIDDAAYLPTHATPGAAGMDLRALLGGTLRPGERAAVRTGLEMAVPEGHAMLLTPRSGLALHDGITLINSPGLIDSDYRGEVCAILDHRGEEIISWEPGDRICQAIIVPTVRVNPVVVDVLEETVRGRGGFGSTGVR